MRIQFRIENPRLLKPACRSKMVFTARGGVIGASEEADWPLQDIHNSIPDFLARIELRDEKWLVTSFPGANVFLNKSNSPLRPNRAVILRRDDLLSFGDLKVYFRDEFEDELNYPRYDDAVEVSALVTVNKGYQGFIESKPIEIEHQVPEAQSYAQEAKWSGHSLVEMDEVDALLRANPEYNPERKIRNKPDGKWEKYLNQAPYQGSLLEPSQFSDHEPKWKSEFEDFVSEVPEMNTESKTENNAEAGDASLTKEQMLIILSQGLGLPLGEVPESELPEVLHDLALSLRSALVGINSIYQDNDESAVRPIAAAASVHAIEDNPLRFSKDVSEALRVMFLERHSIHLTPSAAVSDALEQIQNHNSSVKMSVEIGLDNLLSAFESENLEKRFERYRRQEKDMSEEARDAWHWRTYKAYIREMSNQRQEGLSRLFWEVFQKAYHEQLRDAQTNNNQSKQNEV